MCTNLSELAKNGRVIVIIAEIDAGAESVLIVAVVVNVSILDNFTSGLSINYNYNPYICTRSINH